MNIDAMTIERIYFSHDATPRLFLGCINDQYYLVNMVDEKDNHDVYLYWQITPEQVSRLDIHQTNLRREYLNAPSGTLSLVEYSYGSHGIRYKTTSVEARDLIEDYLPEDGAVIPPYEIVSNTVE